MNLNQTVLFPKELAKNFWLLGNYYFSLYLVKGDRASALIEMGVSATCDTVIDQLGRLNISPDYLIVTHPHNDHVTGFPGLQKRFPGAIPVVGEGAREFIRHPKALNVMIRDDRFVTKSLIERGYPVDRPPISAAFDFPEKRIEVSHSIEIDLGGVTLRCLPVKGHSPGNIAIHLPQKEALMVSDSLGFYYPGRFFCPMFFTGITDYLATIDALAELNPLILGFGHQGALFGTEASEGFANARLAAIDFREEIIANRQDERLAEILFNRYYRDEFSIYSEENIMGCMQLLIRRAQEL